ncbi:VWA domain-containing protein [Flavobacterium sp. K5-23]|uniref:BatA domain-containing protein n=1 Tax=Flavobacterium sp. K5-23 TaxID=2746225 RepID=UPI00200D1393|nr:VWA domain-containing protein [Flavobacterium sp. K5-23]UQD56430.1 BatA domain-containing protein [Flavobacterium sp. K5-23]
MQFKHPEILYFLFLLLIPILVHLFQLRRFKKEFFTNVRFLAALSVQSRKSSRIKKWLLLASRLLLLICLIIAFAQPFFKAEDSLNATNEMYIILDNSFSMQAKGKKGELLKRAVQELLENTPENVNFSLLTNSENYWNTDIKTIQSELQNLKHSAIPFQLDQMLAKVKAHKSAFKKDIIVITDAMGLEKKHLKNSDTSDSPLFIIPKAEQKNNISIDSVYINETLADFYEIGIKLSGYGEDLIPVPVALYNQTKLIAKTIVKFDNSKKNILFTIPKQAFHGYVSIVDNGLYYDNNYYFSISKIKKINVMSIGQAEKSNFLSRIYTDTEFNYNNFSLGSLDYSIIENQQLIILNELDEIPQALQTTLKSFVEKGGNLVVIPSLSTATTNLNQLMLNFGKFRFIKTEKTEKLITKINFNHPLFNAVFENKIDNFQYPSTKNSFSISSSGPAALYNDDQSMFLTSLPNSISTVYVFSAPLNTQNSNFQQSPLIVPVFYKMALNNQNIGINAMTIGNNRPYFIEASVSKDEILTVKNTFGDAAEQFIPVQQILNNKVKLIFNDLPEQAGNFGVFKQKEGLENISFNYSRTESNLEKANEEALSEYKTIESIAAVFDSIQSSRSDNQIWKWFVIFALLFLVSEMAIVRFVK